MAGRKVQQDNHADQCCEITPDRREPNRVKDICGDHRRDNHRSTIWNYRLQVGRSNPFRSAMGTGAASAETQRSIRDYGEPAVHGNDGNEQSRGLPA